MRTRPGWVAVVVFVLPLVLIFSLLVFVVLTTKDCTTASALEQVNVPATPVQVHSSAPFTARVSSWNGFAGNSTSRVIGGVRAAIDGGATVIGLQEISQRAKQDALAAALRQDGWAMSSTPHAARIVWDNARYKVLAQGAQKVFDLERIENGASGTSIGPKWVQWVQLQDRETGAAFSVVNQHIVPTIDRGGHPDTRSPRRLALAYKQLASEVSLVGTLRPYGPVAVTGDFNIDAKADAKVRDPHFPYVTFGSIGVVSNYSQFGIASPKSHDDRSIDYVWLTGDTGRFLNHKVLGHFGSDHRPVIATFTRRGATGAAAPSTGASTAPSPVAVASSQGSQPVPTSLTVQVGGRPVKLDAEQIKVAATTISEGKALGVPQRGWVVALSAAGAESGIRNLDHGDRDSVGPWQMRPSTGWGTVAQIRNVQLAARAFYGKADHTNNPGLTDVKGWQQMTIAQAAQAVERSAFPDAYTKWEAAAQSIVDQLGNSTGAGAAVGADGCPVGGGAGLGDCPPTSLPAEKVLSPDGLLVLRCAAAQFPAVKDIGTYPGHLPSQDKAVDIMIPGWDTAGGKALGDQVAAWVKDHHAELGVQYVIWNAKIWNIERDSEGWRPYASITGHDDPSSLHYNHVHVSVYGNKGTGPTGSSGAVGPGGWHTPVGNPSRVGCAFGCYSGHTGQDFPAPVGTPVYAVTNATVVRSESITSGGTCTTLPICGSNRVSYGNLIVLKLADGTTSTAWYAHLSARNVRAGQTVAAGQVIGAVGYEGHVIPKGPGGAHLHFEIRRGGTPVNPMPYLRSKGVQP